MLGYSIFDFQPCALAGQIGHNAFVSFLCGYAEWSRAYGIAFFKFGTVFDENSDYLQVSVQDGQEDRFLRSGPHDIASFDVGAKLEKNPNNADFVLADGQLKRCPPLVVLFFQVFR